MREAREIQVIDNSIDTQKAVFELKEEYWKRLAEWLKRHPLATAIEQSALRTAVKMSQGYFPDERQCKALMNLRKKAIDEGFAKK